MAATNPLATNPLATNPLATNPLAKNKTAALNLTYYNNTNYPLSIKNQIATLDYNEAEAEKLKYHQFIVKEFFTRNPNQRGLLICHSMGQGKTRLAVSIADYYHKFDPSRRIVVLSAKSLADNFKKEVLAYTKSETPEQYRFVSLNSSNMFKQISNLGKNPDEIALEKKLGVFVESESLHNSLLIIDEAHNLFNSITNGAQNALALYDLIMRTTNLKLIFMSGTPIINNPFELVPCFNMLRGSISLSSDTTYLFSEDIAEFNDYFIDHDLKQIKNKDKFINRIFGLVSYYGDLYFESEGGKPNFPKELEPIIEKVPMSQLQFARYNESRLSELEETSKAFRRSEARFSSASGGSSTYRVKSRQISNYCIPEYALGSKDATNKNKARAKHIHKIKVEDLLNTDEFSPKMGAIYNNIQTSSGLGLVYSQFVSGEGIALFAEVIKAKGYVEYDVLNHNDDIQIERPTFAILSGNIEPDERTRIISVFNSVENKAGALIKLLLLSGAVAEGIDLKRVRHVHIMEPFWNYARINQVKTRAIRYMSHADLPPEQQNVQMYIYLSDYPRGYPDKKITEPTTDIDLYNKSINNMTIINSFMVTLAEASIDCAIHNAKLPLSVQEQIKCRLCAPNNQQLFHPILTKDMEMPSMCQPYMETQITAEEIVLESGEKIYYKKDKTDIQIYQYNKKLNGYSPMLPTNPLYGHVMEKIILAA